MRIFEVIFILLFVLVAASDMGGFRAAELAFLVDLGQFTDFIVVIIFIIAGAPKRKFMVAVMG